ncbi:MAG: TolC family protein, partial [Acidobacteriota bacterium]
ADAEARVADQHAIALSLIAEVARTYLDLRGSQYRLEVAERNASNQQDTYELTQALLEGGRGTALDLARAEAQLQQTLASLAPLETSIAAGMHRLGVLVGEPPGALREALDAARDLPPLPTRLAIGDPASLLRRRPDVRAAERDLAAATARVGVQVGDLFPKITLDGGLGFLATDLGDLFDSAGRNHQIGPFLSWAAFDLGRVRQRIDAAEADAEASLARYEQTVLIVLEETENALVAFVQSRERQARLGIAADASARAAELARVRYRYGADSFLTVLDAERRLLEAQDLQAVAATETAVAFTRLYKALGGGWQVAEDPRPAVPDEAAGR